jgi:GNAT superfamily N-acetyltransferase
MSIQTEEMVATGAAAGQFHVRDALPEDGRPARRLVFDILAEYGIPADPDDSDADVMEFGTPPEGVVHLVAEMNGDLVGSGILTPTSDGRVKLSKLFLRSDHRGKGYGRRMLEEVISRARRDGHREVYLRTRAVYKEAVGLYEATGWHRGPDQPPPGPDRLYSYPL